VTAGRIPCLVLVLATLTALQASPDARAATVTGGAPHSINNDDTCDIALLPAATLLLPYFEVDISAPAGQGETTLFTVTNVTGEEQIAHVTLWTDYAFPVIDFSIYLTGYDTQSLNLYDVIALGQLAPPGGTGSTVSPRGEWSHANADVDLTNCHNLPSAVPARYVARMQEAFTLGRVRELDGNAACTNIGSVHTNASAIGYATIDLVGSCVATTVLDPAYSTALLRHDNVLVGDFIQINGEQNFAQGSPMVHIRAMPDDGRPVNFERTFYGHYQPVDHPKADRRQPLPSMFAARWINGGAGTLGTALKIWRESSTSAGAACRDYRTEVQTYRELATFDDEENGVGAGFPPDCPILCIEPFNYLPSTGRYAVGHGTFPELDNGSVAGWMYLNLAHENEDGIRQAWVVTSMRAEGRYSVDSDATPLGNGCTPSAIRTELSEGAGFIGPAENVNP
jgi:hypothetical protein